MGTVQVPAVQQQQGAVLQQQEQGAIQQEQGAVQQGGNTEFSELYVAAQSLIQIDTQLLYKKALEVATDNANRSGRRIEQLILRSDNMKMNIFQVVGFYLVFQSVLIAVVAQSTTLKRDNLWCPLSLSAVAGVSCLIPVWQNGWAIALLRGDRHHEENIHQVAVRARTMLRRDGIEYSFRDCAEPMPDKRHRFTYFLPYFLVMIFIFSFTLLIVLSQWRILLSV